MSVARAAAHGVAWNMIFGISSRALTLVATLILTHFVAPADYGAVMSASITVLTAGALSSFAFGQYLIARRPPPSAAFQAAEIHFVLGLIAMAAVYALRHVLGDLIDTPQMAPFVAWYAIAHVIERTRYVPERLLMRDLQFQAVARINATGELVFVVSALALASTLGPYAIALGAVVRAGLVAVLYVRAMPAREWLVYSPLQPEVVRALFSYALPITLGAVADRAAMRWDNLIVSKLFGPAVMAQYGLAYSLAEMPISNVAGHIGDVLMPSFARIDDRQRRDAVIRAAALMALIVWPLGVGLAAVAPTLVEALFDPRWHQMAPMLAILAVMTVFLPMVWPPVAYLQAVQHTKTVMAISCTRALVVLPLVAGFGYAGGVEWACAGAAIGYALHCTAAIAATGWLTGLPIRSLLLASARPGLACLPMYAGVTALASALDGAGAHAVLSLCAQIVVGGLVYVGCALMLMRSSTLEFARLTRDLLRRRGATRPVSLESNVL
jgi:PST family polysaccharide transporter